ncbi:sensor histidine kinase [Microbacterium fluvii]|uniref:histidine kinase n=1 Tax=Microbacterium fluvii TaxID=415215 RepID=A0ABW2H8A4_9MICO|nr:HAMP domain-containing sensor histidine kinase [Microbacterium fluvii]MCU4671218.1 HAMP domain-containing histidine kinase [Microbacterium fluvii]
MADTGGERMLRPAASIRTRITIWATLVVAVVLGLGAVAVVALLSQSLTAGVATRMESESASIAEGLQEGLVASAWIAERDDDVLISWHSGTTTVVNDENALALPTPPGDDPVRTVIDGQPMLVVSEQIDEGMLLLGASLAEVDAAVATATTLLAVSVPLAVAVIAVVVWAVATRALAPVERIRRQVEAIDAEALDRRVPADGSGDEIDRLAGTMNRMLDRVEQGYRARQRFVGDASHELRSPLATMRQFAELALAHPEVAPPGELADVVIDEGARMQEILESLLLLARLDETAVRAAGVVDLDDLALAEARRVRSGGGVEVDARAIEPVQVAGDRRLLGRAVANLVDNATRHASTRVAIGVRQVGLRALIWVDDDGSGVPLGERERVFERFVRLDEARSRDAGGAGLGLALVREIAVAHGGAVRIDSSVWGGARFVIELPAQER